MRRTIVSAAACALLFSAGVARATIPLELDLGTAGDYAIVALATGKTLKVNSGPITGDVLVGHGNKLDFSGGGNGGITGKLFYDATVTQTGEFDDLQHPAIAQAVSSALTADAFGDAQSVSNYVATLAATQSFGAINATKTINGNGGLNVIRMTSLHDAALTLHGGADDYFVFDVAGSISTNRVMTLTGGLDASHILWNLKGTGTVFQTAGGNMMFGTFLATHGGKYQFSNLVLTGALINTAGDIQFVSGSHFTSFQQFAVDTRVAVPEPATWALTILGLGVAGGALRRRRRLIATAVGVGLNF